jgi:3-mercaptopyruvate sulfurtransferase SseA
VEEMQVEVMKNMAASQQQMAEMLQSLGIGQNVNIRV